MLPMRAPFLALLALLLAACASTPPPVVTPAPRPSAPVSTPPATQAPMVPAPKGGGYYKDDGPGELVPGNLDDVPDAVPRAEPIRAANTRPYTALGQTFTPMTSLQPYREQGIGSWYGKKFHGAKTASGERYDMFAMTAAHPTLPIPSYARVTNLDNGRSVVVRINDRGPFHRDRVIDLSYTAAHKLGYVSRGSARVEVETIIPEGVDMVANARPVPPVPKPPSAPPERPATPPAELPVPPTTAMPDSLPERLLNGEAAPEPVAAAVAPPTTAPPAAKGIFLQLGAFTSLANAESFRDYVRQELREFESALSVFMDGSRYRLQMGPFTSQAEARQRAERVSQRLKLTPFVVVR